MRRVTRWHLAALVLMCVLAGAAGLTMTGCIVTESCLCPPDRNAAAKSGVQLWTENCTRCHNLRPATTLSDAEWDVALMHMRVRANLTAEEHKKIVEFLKASN